MQPAVAMAGVKRAPSSESRDSGVGQEDESKCEDSGKGKDGGGKLQGELGDCIEGHLSFHL